MVLRVAPILMHMVSFVQSYVETSTESTETSKNEET